MSVLQKDYHENRTTLTGSCSFPADCRQAQGLSSEPTDRSLPHAATAAAKHPYLLPVPKSICRTALQLK